MRLPLRLTLLVALCSPLLWVQPAHAQSSSADGGSADARVNVVELASARRLWAAFTRRPTPLDAASDVAMWTDISVVIEAVAGVPLDERVTLVAFEAALRAGQPVWTGAMRDSRRRDADADRLLALGYSAREVADVLARRISQRALDTARRRLATGADVVSVENYLDGQYRQTRLAEEAQAARAARTTVVPTGAFEDLIARAAALHHVEVAVVRAIIATESGFNPLARSPVGAIGLMQLMPATARELGVNPFVPEQNVEGGVRYFAQLLRAFGRLDLALVAYNAGPGYAERYAKGLTSLYGETRQYVSRVLARLQGR